MKKTVFVLILFLLIIAFVLTGCGVCGTHTETYTTSVKGCDNMENCRCLHKSLLGLGGCDSCECTKEVNNC